MERDKPLFLFQGAIKAPWQSTQHVAADGEGQQAPGHAAYAKTNRQSTAHPQLETHPLMGLLWGKAE